MSVFCDWLDVTCSPEASFLDELTEWVTGGWPVAFADVIAGRTLFSVGEGKLLLERKPRFHRASASGSVLSALRALGEYGDYLTILSSVPHSVTRLDAALDVAVDAPTILRGLERRHSADQVQITRKTLRVTRLYSKRSDGQLTGTWYAGHRSKARITARVYDKQAEALDRRCETLPPTTRYELTFRKDVGCTLRDAYMPASLFYEYSGELIDRDPSVPSWTPHGDGWVSSPVDTDLTFEKYRRRVESSPELEALGALAAQFGPGGVELAVRVYREKLEAAIESRTETALSKRA